MRGTRPSAARSKSQKKTERGTNRSQKKDIVKDASNAERETRYVMDNSNNSWQRSVTLVNQCLFSEITFFSFQELQSTLMPKRPTWNLKSLERHPS